MISAIQSYNSTPTRIAFKADGEKAPTSQADYSYYKTNAGLKTGGVYACIAGAMGALSATFSKGLLNFAKNNGGDAKQVEAASKTLGKAAITIPISMAVYVACGALIDKFINNKRAQFHEINAGKDKNEILKNNPDAETTRSGEVYQHTNVGKKYGALLGAVVSPALGLAVNAIAKQKSGAIGIVSSIISGTVGGLLLGAITDHYANKGAEKYADRHSNQQNDAKQVEINKE